MTRTRIHRALAALLLLATLPQANAGELYAQAIGQPPARPAPARPPARTPEPPEPAATEDEVAAAPSDELKTRILIGAGLAIALGVLAGGGGGGGGPPAGGETVPEHP